MHFAYRTHSGLVVWWTRFPTAAMSSNNISNNIRQVVHTRVPRQVAVV